MLADLLMDGDDKQFAVLYPKFEAHGDQAAALMSGEIDKQPPADAREDDKEALAKRQANAAVALLRMGEAEKAWPVLRHSPDPRVRSYLIHRLSPLGADPRAIVKRLDEEADVTIRRALLLALGEFGEKGLSPGERDVLLPKLFGLYRDDADAGLHGAAEWLLLQWGQRAEVKVIGGRVAGVRGGGSCEAGGEAGPDQAGHHEGQGVGAVVRQRPGADDGGHSWAGDVPDGLAADGGGPGRGAGGEIGATAQQADRPLVRHRRQGSDGAAIRGISQVPQANASTLINAHQYSPTADCPVNDVSWYDAAAYCNWLSEQEGIDKKEWCYLPNKDGEYAEGMKLAPDYLHREGYRLPSEAEWEYACRAGAVTSRYYGETEELLGKYAWYTKNSQDRGMLPGEVGKLGVPGECLKPNDFGLFDMLGNALEWCQESLATYSPGPGGMAAEDIEDERDITNIHNRAMRGGLFNLHPMNVRSADRLRNSPNVRYTNVGFRPARTLR